MDEGGAELEKQPDVSKIFPVSEKSVLSAFKNLSLTENPTGALAESNKEIEIFSEINPHLLDYDEGILMQLPGEEGDRLLEGILVCHRALREEAEARGVVMPSFTNEFIEEFHNKALEGLRTIIDDKKIPIHQAIDESVKLRLDEFQNMEPKFSEIVRKKLNVPDWDPARDFKYLGITNTYFLFREGLKDPKNFQR